MLALGEMYFGTFFILFYIEQNKESFGSYVSEGKVKLSGRL